MKLTMMVILLITFTSSCGDLTNDQRPTTNDYSGSIKATITGSKSFNPNISHGQITQYKVTITGPDISEPVSSTFDGSAESGLIENVPAGKERMIKVEALNPNNAIIREGETGNLEIKAGKVTKTETNMESVPIFTNLADGNRIPNTRFIAKIFSDPNDPVTIEDDFDGLSLPLMDITSFSTEVLPDVSTASANITPPLMPTGSHKLTLKNVRTGRASAVVVQLTDGTRLKSASFYSASSSMPEHFGMAIIGY